MAQSQRRVDGGHIPGAANIPNVVEITLVWQLPNLKIARGKLHGRNPGSVVVNTALANTLFSSLSSAWSTRVGAHMAATTHFQRVEVRDMSDATLPVFQSTAPQVSGTGTAATLPPDLQVVLTEEAAVRGRGLKGRVYLPGWDNSTADTNGHIVPAVQVLINSMGQDWIAALNAASLTPCVAQVARQEYTGLSGALHPARGPGSPTVSSYVCRDLFFDTQRRRDG